MQGSLTLDKIAADTSDAWPAPLRRARRAVRELRGASLEHGGLKGFGNSSPCHANESLSPIIFAEAAGLSKSVEVGKKRTG
ncbi:hypothetical protein EYF80_006088 [Liparis tanakae]|uniref:Uncharacterized protein n=1 Tax=Liparis tanakae TaxID=230148 RepID=A0A4Z2IZW5_9TELE|nr:hypothetical protein EYF80_006088 [Liparis tanakae]